MNLNRYFQPKKLSQSIFKISLGFAFLTMFYLFIEFTFNKAGGANSDFPAHIKFAFNSGNKDSMSYSLLHYAVKVLAQVLVLFKKKSFIYYQLGMIAVILAAQWYSFKILKTQFLNRNGNVVKAGFLAIGLLIIAMLIPDTSVRHIYLGIGTPNPWHNPTYLFSRPFCLLVFYYTLTCLSKNHVNRKTYYLLGVFSILGMAAKPSFFLSFLPAVSLFVGIKFLFRKMDWKKVWKLGLALSFSIIPLLLIYFMAFDNNHVGSENQVIIAPGLLWNKWTHNQIPISIIKAIAFPLFVTLVNIRKIKLGMQLAWLNYIISGCIFYFFAESADRMYDGNFIWTYLFGILFLFVSSIDQFFINSENKNWVKGVGGVLFFLHLLSGIYYLNNQLIGGGYF